MENLSIVGISMGLLCNETPTMVALKGKSLEQITQCKSILEIKKSFQKMKQNKRKCLRKQK